MLKGRNLNRSLDIDAVSASRRFLLRTMGVLEPVPAVTGQKAEYNLDRSFYHRAVSAYSVCVSTYIHNMWKNKEHSMNSSVLFLNLSSCYSVDL